MILIVLALLPSARTLAEDAAAKPGQLVIEAYVDNDSPRINPLNDTDRWYTSGVGLSVSWALDPATNVSFLPWDGDFQRRALGAMIGQQIFTPENMDLKIPETDDRPYGGYLFAGLFYQRANDNTLDHLELDLGMLGPPSLGEDAQKWVHKNFHGEEPHGWDSQIDGEATVQLYLRRKWRAGIDLGGSWAMQAIPQAGLALGTVYRHLEGAVTGRIGFRLPDDFGPGRIGDPTTAATAAPGSQPKGINAFAFTRLGGRVVEHNALVEGSEIHHGAGVDEEPLVGELQVGVAVGYAFKQWSAQVDWSQTYVTDEFEDQEHTHAFGSLNLRVAVNF